ncbi:hypothetical protein [Kitasatospora purpeofusca]|uniref:hypothetical protein n=1 Tax=Kitasatospora purpeofusca TaxID=67352 RepID=UPI00382261BB
MPTFRRTLTAAAALAVLAPFAATGCGLLHTDRCRSVPESRYTAMESLPELDLAPPGARPQGPTADGRSCVDGDGENMLGTGRSYLYDGEAAVLKAFYAAELPGRGWTDGRSTRSFESCFTKRTEAGATVLKVALPYPGEPGGHYTLAVTVAVEGEADCAW